MRIVVFRNMHVHMHSTKKGPSYIPIWSEMKWMTKWPQYAQNMCCSPRPTKNNNNNKLLG
jgi:hypothetical protein